MDLSMDRLQVKPPSSYEGRNPLQSTYPYGTVPIFAACRYLDAPCG
jgi:hypothetical protein